jgi:hypothetical protein
MTNTETGIQVLKTDALGRVRTPAERREQLLDEFEKSGASGQQFAELAGIKYQTFATWVQRLIVLLSPSTFKNLLGTLREYLLWTSSRLSICRAA